LSVVNHAGEVMKK